MKHTTKKAVKKAVKKFGRISCCGKCRCFDNSFQDGFFWFNDKNNSTHVIRIYININNQSQHN